MMKINQLKIMTRDTGASGRHSNAAHWNEEPFVLFNKNLPYCYFESQFLKSTVLIQSKEMRIAVMII
jgi:hypothetical protein